MLGLELFFFIALILYSVAIWSDRKAMELRPWMISVFALAVALDSLGTVLLCATATDALRVNVHTVTGMASLLIMLAHFLWAFTAYWKSDAASAARFRRWSPWAWGLWMVSFLSGAFFH